MNHEIAPRSWTLVFQGSEVQFAQGTDGQLHIRLSAAWVECESEVGYLKPVDLVFERAEWTADLPLCMGTLAEGAITSVEDGLAFARIPLPFSVARPVQASFAFKSGAVLTVSAAAARCTHPDDARFWPSYAC